MTKKTDGYGYCFACKQPFGELEGHVHPNLSKTELLSLLKEVVAFVEEWVSPVEDDFSKRLLPRYCAAMERQIEIRKRIENI